MLQGFGAAAPTTWEDVVKQIATVPSQYLTQEQINKRDLALAKINKGMGNEKVDKGGGGGGGFDMVTMSYVLLGALGIGAVYLLMKQK